MISDAGMAMIEGYRTAIPDYVVHEGIPFPGALITKKFDQIKTFKIRHDDVIIAGYPRSGNHWVKEVVTLLYSEELPNQTGHVYDRIPLLEVAVDLERCMRAYMDRYFQKFGKLQSVFSRMATYFGMKTNDKFFTKVPLDTMAELESRASPRLYHTHLPYHLLPDQSKEGKCKIIVILRNAKDVASSFYEMHKMYPPFGYYAGDFREFLYTFINGQVCFGSWFEHVMGWWNQRQQANILFVKYENMIENLPKEIKRISDFLNKPLSNERIEEISDSCTFAKMKTNPMASYDGLHGAINTKETQFLRKGKVGDWKSKLTVEDNDYFDAKYREYDMDNQGPGFVFELPPIDTMTTSQTKSEQDTQDNITQ